MSERHFAYKISKEPTGLVCTDFEFEEDKMLDVLKDIQQQSASKGIYWIFKQRNGKPQEALCIIDCSQNRIYYHYSGEVETMAEMIEKLTKKCR